MFVFKGTAAAAADVSKNEGERDWRVIDHYNIQQLGKRPFTTMMQPTTLHHRSLTEDARRPSPLQARSRSNTSTVSQAYLESNRPSRAPSVDHFTPRSSSDRRSFSGGNIHRRGGSSDSFGKSLMAKGSRLLRRNNTKQDLTSLHTIEWLEDVNARGSPQEAKPSPIRDAGEGTSPRYNISEPFNFQHLTHTTPKQVETIRKTSEGDLVSEFSAIRAAQTPCRELRGIKAMNIEQGIYFASASETSSPPRTGYSNSPPGTPLNGHVGREDYSYDPPSPKRHLAGKRSIENFSQPSPSYHTAQSSPISPQPSPRVPPHHNAPDALAFHRESPTTINTNSNVTTASLDFPAHPPAACQDEEYDFCIPHAVTTPDDTALPVRSPPFSMVRTELPGVPEEDEMSEERRSSIATSFVRPTTPTSSLRHAKSFPSIKSSPQHRHGVLPGMMEEDDTLLPHHRSIGIVSPCTDEHVQEVPTRPHAHRHISLHREESWEDVIDYCYELEAEADCNFDWGLASRAETYKKSSAGPANGPIEHIENSSECLGHTENTSETSSKRTVVAPRPTSSNYSSSPPPLQPLQTSLPDLQPPVADSAESSFSSIPEAATPLSPDTTIPIKPSPQVSSNWCAPVPSTPLVMSEDSSSEPAFDEFYQDMLRSHAATDYQLLFTTGRADGSTISNSPRSSRSPISKSSSQESFWYAQARRHRNTGSIGSLPELVQHRSNEKPDVVDDALTDQVASLSTSEDTKEKSQHRRSPSLAKDVAMKSILSKTINPEAAEVPEVPLPMHPAFRERSTSDAFPPLTGTATAPPQPQPASAVRMRSVSSASSLSSRRPNRVSYSLFPSALR